MTMNFCAAQGMKDRKISFDCSSHDSSMHRNKFNIVHTESKVIPSWVDLWSSEFRSDPSWKCDPSVYRPTVGITPSINNESP